LPKKQKCDTFQGKIDQNHTKERCRMLILTCPHLKPEAIFVCAQAGCQNCLAYLLEQNIGLVHACVRYADLGGVPYLEAVEEGRIGLWRAILHYDPGRQVAFSTFAWRRIWGCIWRYWVTFRQKGEELEEEPYEAGQAELAEAAWQQEQISLAVREVLETLPERLRDVLTAYYGLNGQPPLALTAIGQDMGLTGERIRQLRNEGLVLLRIPALSIRLRGLCERDSRRDYRTARQDNNAWLRRRRGMK
jgi:RNA polymerase sigma factor (sigma-70 family)